MKRLVVGTVMAALLVAGCGGDEGTDKEMTLSEARSAVIEAGISCDGEPMPWADADQEDLTGLAEDPKMGLDCGNGLLMQEWSSASARERAADMGEAMACQAGGEGATWVEVGSVMAGLVTEEGFSAQGVDALGQALDAEPTTADC